jgi:hypothetical protein
MFEIIMPTEAEYPSMPTDPNVSQLNPIYILLHDFCNINFNLTLPLSFSKTFPLKFYRHLHRITCSSSWQSTLTILMNVKQWYSTETGNFVACTCFLFCKECLTNNSFQVTMLSQSRGCMCVRTYVCMYTRARARARSVKYLAFSPPISLHKMSFCTQNSVSFVVRPLLKGLL